MLKKFMNRMHHNQKGITGLETAIILIAFVVVAAVFAFTVLSAGLFSTEKSKEAVYSGLKEAQSTLELKGSVTTNAVQAIDEMDALNSWASSDGVNTVLSGGSIEQVKEGAASLKVACVITESAGDYWYEDMPVQSFSATDTISFWVYSSADLASGDLKFGLGNAASLGDITGNTFDVGGLVGVTHGIWTYVTGNVALNSAAYYGFEYTAATAADIYIDMIQGPVPASDRINMPTTYVDSVEFTVVNALGGEPIDFALPTDTNSDGVLNTSDATKTNYLTISYDDAYQQIFDLAWTVTRIIGVDDYLLENNEIFKVTVDLKAVNLGATGNEKIGTNHEFNIEVKPTQGAVLRINKTTPQVLYTVDDLN